MFDTFPFLRITNGSPEEKIEQIVEYLVNFKEQLEFELRNIGTDNLSPDIVSALRVLGVDVQKNKEEQSSELGQVASRIITVDDVTNSEKFLTTIKNEVSKVRFNINFENGHLEYDFNNEEGN